MKAKNKFSDVGSEMVAFKDAGRLWKKMLLKTTQTDGAQQRASSLMYYRC